MYIGYFLGPKKLFLLYANLDFPCLFFLNRIEVTVCRTESGKLDFYAGNRLKVTQVQEEFPLGSVEVEVDVESTASWFYR